MVIIILYQQRVLNINWDVLFKCILTVPPIILVQLSDILLVSILFTDPSLLILYD